MKSYSKMTDEELKQIASKKNIKGVATGAAYKAQIELYKRSWDYHLSDRKDDEICYGTEEE